MSFKFESRDHSIEEALFGIHQLRIPQFQRPYTWEEDQCSDFWNDFVDDNSFFLGQFILNYENYQKEKYVDIVDGQQRTTTILILCAVLRDKLKELGYEDDVLVVQENVMLARRDFSGPIYRITVSPTLKEFFEEYIQSGKNLLTRDLSTTDLTDEQKRVHKNYLFLKDELDKKLEGTSPSQQVKEIKDLFNFLKSAQIIVTKINDENDAYEIFESVNATGIELNVADLLKNFLFKKIKNEIGTTKDVYDKWTEIVEMVKDSEIDLTKFIRYYWLSKYGSFVSESKLFRVIKNSEINNWNAFLVDLYENAQLFYELRNPTESDFNGVGRVHMLKDALFGIRIMNITQCYVFLLAIYRNREKIKIDWLKIFKLIENFNFLYHTNSRLPANRIERVYHEFATKLEKLIKTEDDDKAIRVAVETDFNNFSNKLKSLKPDFSTFETGFTQLSYKKRPLCRYVLSKIENSRGTEEYIINQSTVTIEHILPKKPDKSWKLTQASIKNYVDNIGNLTLLGKKPNSKVGNKSIAEKIEILEEETEIDMTKNLLNQLKESKKWGKSDIEIRAKELARVAFEKVWAL